MSEPAVENIRALLECIHQCFMTCSSGAIVAQSSDVSGEIGIEYGRMVHAHWGDMQGEEAFWAILKTPGITTHFVENQGRLVHNIQRPAELILMDASIFLDQLEKDAQRALEGISPPRKSKRLVRRTTVVQLQPEASVTGGAKCYVLDEGHYTIGRNQACDLVISDPTVSSRHATLDVCKGLVTLRDEASRNGTFVNGARIQAPVCLNDGDEVALGAASLRFHRSQAGQAVLIEQPSVRPELGETSLISRS
jgi:hypothetical protein